MKIDRFAILALLSFAAAAPANAQAAIGPDAASCREGASGPAILVNVHGFRKQTGTIRVQLHGSDGSTWLQKLKWMRRIELPVTGASMPVCIAVPAPGRYAIAVRHDEDGDHTMTSKDGGGYSRNPKLSIFHYKPTYSEVVFNVGPRITPVDVELNYLSGLTIGPVG